MRRLLATLLIFALPALASAQASDSVAIEELTVDVASVSLFHAYLILSNQSAKVMIHCRDGSGDLQSSIDVISLNPSSSAVDRLLFVGTDFYCYGAIGLARNLAPGNRVSVRLATVPTSEGTRVSNVEISREGFVEKNTYDFSVGGSTSWYRR